jgi:hypothetical protein
MTKKELESAYQEGLYAIEKLSGYGFDEFDERLNGSIISDEMNNMVFKCQEKMCKILKKRFLEMGYKVK